MGEIGGKVEAVDHVVQGADDRAQEHEDQEGRIEGLFPPADVPAAVVEGQDQDGQDAGVDIGHVLIAGQDGIPGSQEVGTDQLPDIGVDPEGGEGPLAADGSLPKRGGDRDQDDGSGHGAQKGDQDKAAGRPHKSLSPFGAVKGGICKRDDQGIDGDQDTDQDRKIEIDDHGQGKGDVVEHRLIVPDQFFTAKGHQREEGDCIQPHGIPVVAGDKGTEAVEEAEDQDREIVSFEMLSQVPGKGGAAQAGLDQDQNRDALGDQLRREEEKDQVQRGGRIVGRLGQEILAQACLPAVDQTFAGQEPAAEFGQIGRILMKEVHLEDGPGTKGPELSSGEDQDIDCGADQEGRVDIPAVVEVAADFSAHRLPSLFVKLQAIPDPGMACSIFSESGETG